MSLRICALVVLALLGTLVGAAALISPSQHAEGLAAVYTVNTTDDDDDLLCTMSPGDCTLREAILAANMVTQGEIRFDISGCPPACTIDVGSQLPFVTATGTLIDGTTEPDYAGEPIVILDGGDAVDAGILLEADDSGVAGLTVENFGSSGVNFLGGAKTRSGRFVRDSVISHSGAYGVVVTGSDNLIVNNLIEFSGGDGIGANFGGGPGLTITGNTIRNSGENGIEGIQPEMVVSGNTIVDNAAAGLALDAGDGGALTIEGNTISGNGEYGIREFGTAATVSSNIVTNNGWAGIYLGVSTPDEPAVVIDNTVMGNGIGEAPVRNAGTVPELLHDGIVANTPNTSIQGNTVTGNVGNGITIFVSGQDSLVGGDGGDTGNTISGNGLAGIWVIGPNDPGDPFVTGVTIQRNSISGNGTLGIDLAPVGPEMNDEMDDDDGTNRLQNYPVLKSAIAGSLAVTGILDSRPETTFRIDFYLNEECDASGFGEGANWIESIDVSTPESGVVDVNLNSKAAVSAGEFVAATATNLGTGDTSEFSECIEVQGPSTPTPVPTETPVPTLTPTPTGGPTVTPTPSASETPGPTETPGPKGLAGDMDCDGDVDAVDALALLRHVAGLPPLAQQEPCPDVGSAGFAFGDLDCDGDVDAVDALAVLRFVAALSPLAQQEPCTDVGT